MTELLRGLPPLLASHLELASIALVVAAAISLPLAIAISNRPRLAFAVVTVASVIQTIPGLALLALMVPVLSALDWLSPFGFPPAVIALTLYAILPILRNAVTGLRGVDPAATEAARGMGMTPWQVIRLVQLPLAAPVIAAGVRTATVWTVGAATLATPIGAPCLGNYIFTGLQTRNFAMLIVGVVAAAALAIILDAVLAGVERALASRRRGRVWIPIGAFGALALVVFVVLPLAVTSDARVITPATTATGPAAIHRVRIASKTFTEQYILVELLRARLEGAGLEVEIASGLGSTVIFDALIAGDVDAYVDYSGTLWTNAMKRTRSARRWRALSEVSGWLAHQHAVRTPGSLGFENTYALAVRRETAERLRLRTLADLAAHRELAIGADYEFFGRAEWTALVETYGLGFARRASFDPSLLYEAVARGEVDVISAFSTDGRIAAFDLVVLEDPAAALPPYDAMILIGPRVADDARIACALSSLRITAEAMRRANARVDRQEATPAVVAAELLATQPPLACER